MGVAGCVFLAWLSYSQVQFCNAMSSIEETSQQCYMLREKVVMLDKCLAEHIARQAEHEKSVSDKLTTILKKLEEK